MESMSNEYFFFREGSDSDKLIVMFSGAGSKNFAGFKLLNFSDSNVLFVRDPNRGWYNEGVEGGWEDVSSLESILKDIVIKFGEENCTFIGGSMGGYAAILFGALLGVSSVLAFSPQLVLDSRFPNNPRPSVKLVYPELYSHINSAINTRFTIYLGSECIEDIYNIYPLMDSSNVIVKCISGAPHNAMHFLHELSILESIIERYLNKNECVPLALFSLSDSMVTVNNIVKFTEGFYFSGRNCDLIINLSDECPHWNILKYWLGRYYLNIKEYEKAISAFKQFSLSGGDCDSYYYEGLSHIQTKNYSESERCFQYACKLNPNNLNYRIKLGAAKMFLGKLDESVLIQESVLDRAPMNSQAMYQLGLLMLKLNQFEKSVFYFERAISSGDQNQLTRKHLETARMGVV